MRKIPFLTFFFFAFSVYASPIIPMNKAFNSLMEIIPFLVDEKKFIEKKNEKIIRENMISMNEAFKNAKHDGLMKQDIFAPSLEIIRSEIQDSLNSFNQGKKDYAWWQMRSITSQCMACHTRLPPNHPSSFQDGSRVLDKSKFNDPYNLGLAQLIVRQYPQAKESFTRAIDESIVKKQFENILLPIKQLLLIQTKVMKDPAQMLSVLNHYETKTGFSLEDRETMKSWKERLALWSTGSFQKWRRLSTSDEAETFMDIVMKPLFKNNSLYVGKHDVDLLMAQGLLSNFLFENPESKQAPVAMYWIGVAEKYLERENFFGAGELFLRDCVKRYPQHPVAKQCLSEYKESIEFNFSGSAGTNIPSEIQKELKQMESLVK